MRTTHLLILAALLLVGVGCQRATYRKAAVDEFADSATGAQIIEASLSRDTIIKLDGSEATGFRWVPKYDHSIVEFVKDEYVPKGEKPADGAFLAYGGQLAEDVGAHYFAFRMLKTGESLLDLSFARAGENGPPAKEALYLIRVQQEDEVGF